MGQLSRLAPAAVHGSATVLGESRRTRVPLDEGSTGRREGHGPDVVPGPVGRDLLALDQALAVERAQIAGHLPVAMPVLPRSTRSRSNTTRNVARVWRTRLCVPRTSNDRPS